MPTAKPRISVTLEESQHHLLARVAAQQGKSISALVGELVEAVAPSYERLAVLMDQASRANSDVLSGVVSAVERAEETIVGVLGPSIVQHDLFQRVHKRLHDREIANVFKPDVRVVVSSPARSAGQERQRSDPRTVITGVRSRTGHAKSRRGGGAK